MPVVYSCPSAEIPDNFTTYCGIVGEDSCFHPSQPRTISEIADGTSNTLLVLEVSQDEAVHWMDPRDTGERFVLTFREESELAHPGGTQAALADGSVQFLSAKMSAETRTALMTIDGGEVIESF